MLQNFESRYVKESIAKPFVAEIAPKGLFFYFIPMGIPR